MRRGAREAEDRGPPKPDDADHATAARHPVPFIRLTADAVIDLRYVVDVERVIEHELAEDRADGERRMGLVISELVDDRASLKNEPHLRGGRSPIEIEDAEPKRSPLRRATQQLADEIGIGLAGFPAPAIDPFVVLDSFGHFLGRLKE